MLFRVSFFPLNLELSELRIGHVWPMSIQTRSARYLRSNEQFGIDK